MDRKEKMKLVYNIIAGVMIIVGIIGFIVAFITQPQENPALGHSTPTRVAAKQVANAHQSSTTAQVVLYANDPGAAESSIHLTVNGEQVFVEQYDKNCYARFAFTGTVHVSVTEPQSGAYTVFPAIQTTRNGGTLSFTLSHPQDLTLQSGNEKLFIFAVSPEMSPPQVGPSGVVAHAG